MYITCFINKVPIKFEIDSGSSVSTLKYSDACILNANIRKYDRDIKSYSGNLVDIRGQTQLNVLCGGTLFQHNFIVVNSESVNLFGRDFARKLNMHLVIPNDKKVNDSLNINKIDVLKEFKEYLSNDYVSCVTEKVHLNVKSGANPLFSKARTIPIRLKKQVKEEIDRLVKNGILEQVFESPWSSPTVNILKSNNSVRICGDFSSTVNKYLDPVNSPLVSIDDVISEVGDARYFSKIDLSNAFLQLPLDNESKIFTTINTSEGLFRYNYLPFGLSCSPGIFQAFISRILNGIPYTISYQDDILILCNDIQTHNQTLRSVLNRLKNAGIKINISKSHFLTDKVEYLGHWFDKNGVHPDSNKLNAILNAPCPINLKQLQSFLGLCNFYSRFIPKFSKVVMPLYQLLKKNTPFRWNKEQDDAFKFIKNSFNQNNILSLYNPDYDTMVETDSSAYGVGAVLYQRRCAGESWHTVQFASRTLNSAEQNYSNIEREALSVLFACEKYRKYLLGKYFIIKNDHKPLEKILKSNSTQCSARLQRWSHRLSQFNFKFIYSKGKDNVVSDCLSRLPLPETSQIYEPYELIFSLKLLDDQNISCNDVAISTKNDKNLCDLMNYIKFGWPVNNNNKNIEIYKKFIPRMSIFKGCIMLDNRVLIPQILRSNVIEMFHEGHPGIVGMKSIVRSVIWYPGIDKDVENYVKNCRTCQINRAKPAQNNNIEWPKPKRPWSRLNVDHFFYNNIIVFIVVDSFSKYIELEIVKSTSVQDTMNALRLIFSRQGIPDTLVSDNASCFTSESFSEFLIKHGIKHLTPPPYSPSSNGQAERGVRVVKDLLRRCNSKEPFHIKLARVMFYYRTTPHSITQIPPCVALNNRKYISIKDKINPKFYDFCEYDKSRKISHFYVGDRVLALNLRPGPKWLEATVVKELGINIFEVRIHEYGTIWKRHSNQLVKSELEERQTIPPSPDFKHDLSRNKSILTREIDVPKETVSSENEPIPIIDNFDNPGNISNDNVLDSIQADSTPCLRRSTRIAKPVQRYGF